ncbi:uncharacterized protein LY89DRAFT_644257 [Mollisia scopiformis]|uniref:BHLH domain-containing protein n=1 Tax=Mollisia scopiformis TaxID=149040 RepID=A0A194XEQ9_MOLSC|nr:uncharacterized protein LY89DRAFT_644257 [Mollisia scopiformis]KUJ18242.1 hypothetical protein LY89DRAFT_644257 [Mollisia scopiformis]
MLAVQRPSMGSSKPPNLEMPFGYSFDTSTSHFPIPSPTAPAPGPSLLDDNESKFLDSFFDGVSNDHFNYDFFNTAPDGSELGMGWDELPPTFMGTTSSFGQQSQQAGNHGLPAMNYNEMNPPPNAGPSIPSSTTADVIAAATLLQNGSNGRSQSLSDGTMFRHNPPATPTSQPRAMSMSQQIPTRPQPFQQRSNSDDYMRDNFYTEMVFGPQSDGSMRQRGVPQKVDIRWGSDAGFASPQGFVAPAVQDDVAAVERSHMHAIEQAFAIIPAQISSSAETTRPSSPARLHETNSNSKSHQRTKSIVKEEEDDDDQDSRPRKRRKNKAPTTDDADEDDNESPISSHPKQQNTKKRKSLKKGISDSPTADQESGHKRRKSTGAAIKPTRENLTEDQKRENHIKSEQKRRTLIREGFEDLGELVPGLRGGGFSKSAVLIMAADWLEELIQGNEVLQARLDQMEGRG